MAQKFPIGSSVIVTGEGWKKGRVGYVDAFKEGGEVENEAGEREKSPAVYHVYFPDVNRKVYVTESELLADERLRVEAEEVIIIDSDKVPDVNVAAEIGSRMNRMVVHMPGGMKGIEKVNRKDLRAALDKTDPVAPPKK